MPNSLHHLTIKQAHEGLEKAEFSASELTEDVINSIFNTNKKLNAFIEYDTERAINEARLVDQEIKQGNITFLTGIPAAIKDVIITRGIQTTAGSKVLKNYIPPYDATVVAKLKKAGMVIVGKTNCDEFAMGASGENSAYGSTKNPWDLDRVPGGSSSGSAAAVAADNCIYSLGTDTGGSVRQPAAFCGVVGLKPTYGRVSRHGLIAMTSSMDQIGTITKTVEDAAMILPYLAGVDEKDATSVPQDIPNYWEIMQQDIKGLRIGLPKEYFIEGVDDRLEAVVKKAVDELIKLGAEVSEVSLPHTEYALAVYYIIVPAEVSANLARYDGIRYGQSAGRDKNVKDLSDVYFSSRQKYLGEEVKRRIMLGTYALSSGYYDAYYLQAQKVRTLIRKDFDKVWEKVDCLVTPTSPTVAFKLGEKYEDPLTMYLSDIFTVSANVAGLPAISVPCGFVNDLPVGLQIMGKHFDEETILRVAHHYEQATSWHKQKVKTMLVI